MAGKKGVGGLVLNFRDSRAQNQSFFSNLNKSGAEPQNATPVITWNKKKPPTATFIKRKGGENNNTPPPLKRKVAGTAPLKGILKKSGPVKGILKNSGPPKGILKKSGPGKVDASGPPKAKVDASGQPKGKVDDKGPPGKKKVELSGQPKGKVDESGPGKRKVDDGEPLGKNNPPKKRIRDEIENQTKTQINQPNVTENTAENNPSPAANLTPDTQPQREWSEPHSRSSEGDDSRGFVSSLFSGNPDIPFIPSGNVERISEKVFSEDAFGSLNIAYQIVSNVEKLGFSSMTQVQAKSIPPILKGQDALVKSQTGSGKTLTYAIPIIHKLMMREERVTRSEGVLALVIVPTRELALQSYQWFEKLCKSCVWVVPGYLIGGEKKKAEKARLRKGINILIGTPGRLIDHLHHTKSLSLSNVKYLVIDEADRLLDMGYERSLTSIIETLREHQPGLDHGRQTIMLSATLSSGVEKLAGMSLISPEIIDISHGENKSGQLTTEAMATPENLTHNYILVPAKLRLVTLIAFILSKCKFGDERKMIIFFATQDMVDYHTAIFKSLLSNYGKKKTEKKSSLLKRAEKVLAGEEDEGEGSEEEEEEEEEEETVVGDGILFQKLHGNMTQQDRSTVFKSFRESSAGVLMCTDVASRGLDLPKVRWIVQFSPACTVADYVHRVGRTARVNALGSAIIFITPAEAPYIQMLHKHSITLQEILMQTVLRSLMVQVESDLNKHSGGSVEAAATRFQVKVEKLLVSDPALYDLAKRAYVSFVRSYASYPREVRDMFNFKKLHLGHYAKSMGLRDTPSALGASAAFRAKRDMKDKKERRERKKNIQVMNQKLGMLPKTASMSEFDSGFDTMTKNIKKKGKMKR